MCIRDRIYTLPSLSSIVEYSDNQDSSPYVSQSPTSGTELGLGTHSVFVTVEDDCGNSAECEIFVYVQVGVNVSELEGISISMFPNPADQEILLRYEDSTSTPGSIEIRNMLGQVVLTVTELTQEMTIPTSDLANGMYSINLLDNQGGILHSEKVLVKH